MIEIRAARQVDAAAIGECMVRSWLHAHRGQMPGHLYDARVRDWTPAVSAAGWHRTIDEIDAGARPAGTLLVAAAPDDGAIVGIGLISVRTDVGEVDALYVLPEWQRAGIGSELLRRLAHAVAEYCVTVELSVLEANAPARQFYERVGGVPARRSVELEGDVELPAVVYRWERESLARPVDR